MIGKYRKQNQVQEEELQIIKVCSILIYSKEQYLRIQQIYLSKIQVLEENEKKLTKKYSDLERRRNLEIEGFGRDVDGVKRKIKLFDLYMARLKKLVQENPQEIMGKNNG